MKLEANCNNCGRRFFLTQILPEPGGTSGRCPFCGFHFGRHYVSLLPDAVKGAEMALGDLLAALERLNGMHPGFMLDLEALTRRINEEAAAAQQQPA